jgi:peroxiredoxin
MVMTLKKTLTTCLLMASGLMLCIPSPAGEPGEEEAWKNISELYQKLQNKEFDKEESHSRRNELIILCDKYNRYYPHGSHIDSLWGIMVRTLSFLMFYHHDTDLLDKLITDRSFSDKTISSFYYLKFSQIYKDNNFTSSALKPIEAKAREFMEQYQDAQYKYKPLYDAAMFALLMEDYNAAKRLFTECQQSINPSIREDASLGLQFLELENKPFELKFKDICGRQIDISEMRGKAILVYFWKMKKCESVNGTGNSSQYEPFIYSNDMHKLYEAYKDKGLEIIGICLDDEGIDKETLLKEYNHPWPQFVAPEDKDSIRMYMEFIHQLPSLWLINKKGFLVDRNFNICTDQNFDFYNTQKIQQYLDNTPYSPYHFTN